MGNAWEIRDRFGIEHLTLARREVRDPGPGEARVTMRARRFVTPGTSPTLRTAATPLVSATRRNASTLRKNSCDALTST